MLRETCRWLGGAAMLMVTIPAIAKETSAQAPKSANDKVEKAPAPAGPTSDNPPQKPIAENANQVGEIVVTAQRRAENLQRVPIVVTVVSGQQLANAGVISLPTLSLVAPGLNARTSGGGVFQPSIRGIGTSSNVVENPVALYLDGVYLPNQNEGNRELPDVEQVAVLKGPQGTLFGRNATGGVIQITTRRPSQELHAQAKAEIDNYATFRGGVFLSGGLAPGVAASVSADYAHQGRGWGKNLTTGNDTFRLAHSVSLRGKLLIEPASHTSVLFIGDYMDRKTFTYTFVPYPGTSFIRPLPTANYNRQDTFSPVDPFATFKGGGISMAIEQGLGSVKLVSITAYRKGSTSYLFDDVPIGSPVFYVGVGKGDQRNKSFTQELQLVSTGRGPLSFTGGLFYYFNRNANLPIVRQFFPTFYGGATVGPPAANRTTQTYGAERTTSFAPFAQATLQVLDGTRLTLGARYTYEKRKLDGQAILNRYNGTSTTLLFAPSPLTIKKPSWRIALDHQFAPAILGYVSYNRGIKSGGFNILNPANPAYLPESLDAYEAGLKTELFNRRLRFNAGGFFYNYNNIQVTQFVGVSQTIVNGAKARLYGLDLDFNGRISPELSVNGGVELLHARFVSYPNAVGSTPRPTGGAALMAVNASGNRIPQAQRFAGTIAVDYDKRVSFGNILANVTVNHNGSYKFEADNFLGQGPYTLINASLGWRSRNEHYSISLWARNLLDEIVLNNGTTQAIGYPVSYGQPPRTVGVTAKFTY